jgi:asparaginyl-tRNA synthetase
LSKTESIRIPGPLEALTEEELRTKAQVAKVTTEVLRSLTGTFCDDGFEWLLPVVLSKSTDPLWPDPGASIEKRVEAEIYGSTVRATLSMIIHKLVACSLAYPKLFILSPNLRIEKAQRKSTGKHIYEFTQLDFEIRDAGFQEVKTVTEKALSSLIAELAKKTRDGKLQLGGLKRLKVPRTPFAAYDRKELVKKFGDDWEAKLPNEIGEPVWVRNIPREFYDYQDLEIGDWDNYDLFLPGFGEVLSGARRESEYEKISKKIARDGVKKENYALLLKLAKEGRLKPSAGAGIGIERLIAWLVGARHIGEVQTFPKVPGEVYEL